MKKEREQIEAVKAANPKASLREIAEQTGVNYETARRRLSQKSSIDEKCDRPTHSQRTSARQVYLPLDPKAAADRLVQKFGRQACRPGAVPLDDPPDRPRSDDQHAVGVLVFPAAIGCPEGVLLMKQML